MIGNNACGSRALGYGRTVGQRRGAAGRVRHRRGVGRGGRWPVTDRLAAMGDHHLAHIRTEFGRFTRQVSGYSLEHLLPERRRLDRFLVGSEGTLGVVLEATVRLVAEETGRLLVVLGYPSMAEAADAVPELLSVGGGRLIACEGLDARIVDLVKARGAAVPGAAAGRGLAVRRGRRARTPGRWPTRSSPRRRRSATARSPTSPSRPRCGGSARTAPAWRRAACAPRRTPAGRTPRCRRSGSAPGCATSTSCCASTTSTGCPTATSATAACTSGSTSRSRPATSGGRGSSATSSPPAPTSCASTAARCRASTATAGRARSCCR